MDFIENSIEKLGTSTLFTFLHTCRTKLEGGWFLWFGFAVEGGRGEGNWGEGGWILLSLLEEYLRWFLGDKDLWVVMMLE